MNKLKWISNDYHNNEKAARFRNFLERNTGFSAKSKFLAPELFISAKDHVNNSFLNLSFYQEHVRGHISPPIISSNLNIQSNKRTFLKPEHLFHFWLISSKTELSWCWPKLIDILIFQLHQNETLFNYKYDYKRYWYLCYLKNDETSLVSFLLCFGR